MARNVRYRQLFQRILRLFEAVSFTVQFRFHASGVHSRALIR
jgi:hypothetical protein